jgi:hypothetical protein
MGYNFLMDGLGWARVTRFVTLCDGTGQSRARPDVLAQFGHAQIEHPRVQAAVALDPRLDRRRVVLCKRRLSSLDVAHRKAGSIAGAGMGGMEGMRARGAPSKGSDRRVEQEG